jgi:hypothetical protein
MRRHRRNLDPYQTRGKFSELFELMKSAVYPKGISDEDFRKLLYAIQYAERHPEKESNSGRRARFDATFLFNSSLKIKAVLQNETGGRISLLRFITTYLPIPNYPHDIQTALNAHKINLEEARILARINRATLGDAIKRKPSEIRREIIDSHIKRQGTQLELKRRVDVRLNTTSKKQAHNVAANVAALDANTDELLEFNESDTEHLLWEEIKGLVYLMREVDSALVDEEATEEILRDLDSIKLRLLKFRRNEMNS